MDKKGKKGIIGKFFKQTELDDLTIEQIVYYAKKFGIHYVDFYLMVKAKKDPGFRVSKEYIIELKSQINCLNERYAELFIVHPN